VLPVFPDPTTYDEAARYLLMRAGAFLLYWLLRLKPSQVRFDSWLPTQLTLPGVKQRLCDGIARLADLEHGEAPFAAIVEIQTRPDGTMPGRLLLAGGLVLLLLKPEPLPGDRYELLAIVINLTGKGKSTRRMALGDTAWTLVPCELDVETLDAGKILEEIATGKAPRELLALIPLMQRGSEDGIMSRWQEVVEMDTDLGRRGDYSLALVFADAVGLRPNWEPTVRGLKMIESPLVREWKDEARVEAKVDAVVRVVRARYKGAPEELADGIRRCRDLATLDRWLDSALAVDDLGEFRRQTGL
jgi:hypothetical protein